ncbi:MAG: hypothetical protein GX166_01275 [Clostridiaceae bacterium]|nr:hypothetical protein [Clostridiaceae bacterium]
MKSIIEEEYEQPTHKKSQNSEDKGKRMPIWQILIIDFLAAGILINVFAFFHHVLPRTLDGGVNIIGRKPIPTFGLPANPSMPVSTPRPYEESKRYSESPYTRQVDLIESFKNENSEVYLRKVVIGSGKNKITYYVADVFVNSVMSLKTAFARGKYGMNIKDDILDIAEDNDAILAISGDYYTNNDIGVVIRNGVYYRANTRKMTYAFFILMAL